MVSRKKISKLPVAIAVGAVLWAAFYGGWKLVLVFLAAFGARQVLLLATVASELRAIHSVPWKRTEWVCPSCGHTIERFGS
jgi:hypothetical protein